MSRYLLRISSSTLGCIVGLNDAAIYEDPSGRGISAIRSVNEWVLPDDNHFTAYIFWPAARRYEPATSMLRSSLVFGEVGQEPERTVLPALEYPPREAPEVYPFRARIKFAANPIPPCHLWEEAERVNQLDDSDRSSILGIAEAFRRAILSRDVNRMYQLTEYKFEDRARAEGFDLQESRDAAQTLYSEMTASAELKVSELRPSAVSFDTIADGAVWRATMNGEKLIQMEDETTTKRIDVYVSRINGKWLIVR